MTGVMGIPSEREEIEEIVSEPTRRRLTIAWCHTGDSGGSKRAAFELVRELARRGHIIDEYVIRIGEPNDAHWPLGPYVRRSYRYVLPPTGNRFRPYLLQVWVSLVQDLWRRRALTVALNGVSEDIRTRGYDLIHIDHCSPSYTVSLSAMVALPTVVYSHEVSGVRYHGSEQDGEKCRGVRRLYRRGCDWASRLWADVREREDLRGIAHAQLVMTNSYYSKEAMFQRARRACVVCRYGVDTETFRPLGVRRDNMILSAGRLVEAKQHHLVIEAMAKIHQARRPRLVIATPESLTHQEDPDYAERVVRSADAGKVALEIRRNPTESELVGLYNRALMLVFVPVMEPFGLVALEAMACGTPVVGIREGGVRESVLDSRTGLLVDRDPAELSQAIDRLLEHGEDRERYGVEAAAYVRREWTWDRSVDRYEAEVGRLLMAPRPVPA